MPQIVIDARVILAWLRADLGLPHDDAAGAQMVRDLYYRPLPPDADMTDSTPPTIGDLLAPRLIHYDALEGFVALGMAADAAQRAMSELFGLLAPVALREPPYERVLRLTKRTGLELRLCVYAALAEVEGCPLVVGDARLAQRLRAATSIDVRSLHDF